MKSLRNLILTFSFILLFTSCEDDLDTTTVIGKWKLIETLSDPGDGSGEYEKVDTEQILTFLSDSTVTYTGELCNSSDEAKSGIITENRLYPNDCSFSYGMEIKNDHLYLFPPCIEPCGLKFEKIAD